MKKRFSRLTALFLSLTMALTLALPAWAVEDAPPPAPDTGVSEPADSAGYAGYLDRLNFSIQYTTVDHPEYYEAFDADAWFAEHYGDWYSKEEFMPDWELADEAAFKEYMWEEYLSYLSYNEPTDDPLYQELDAAYNAYLIQIYEARHPGELDGVSTESLLASWGYTQTLTPIEQFMQDKGITDPAQVRPYLLGDYVWDRLRAESNHAKALTYREMYPEQWAGFDADAWFASYRYWDNKSDYMDLYHLFTEEEFREDMFVEYADRASWQWDISLPDGGRLITLMVNGERSEAAVTLIDGACYASADVLNPILGAQLTGDRIAIRQAAQEAGWDVVWSASENTVYLYRRADLPQGDFSKFDELMDRVLAAAKTEKGQSYKTTENIDLKLTAFNTLDGDKTHTARAAAELIQKDSLYELTVTLNAAELMPLIPKASLDLMDAQFIKDLTTLMRGCKFTLLLNGETGELYINAPLLALIDDTYKENTWLRAGLGSFPALPFDLDSLEWNTNDFLYQELLNQSARGSWFAYYSYLNSQETLSALMGPQNLTEKNGTLTWTLNTQSLKNLLPEDEEIGAQVASIFKEYNVTLSVDQSGKMTSDAAFRLDMDALASLIAQGGWGSDPLSAAFISWLTNLFDFRMDAHASGTADSSSSSASFHWKNQFKLEMSGDSTRQKTSTAPKSAPPEGAEILDLMDLA